MDISIFSSFCYRHDAGLFFLDQIFNCFEAKQHPNIDLSKCVFKLCVVFYITTEYKGKLIIQWYLELNIFQGIYDESIQLNLEPLKQMLFYQVPYALKIESRPQDILIL